MTWQEEAIQLRNEDKTYPEIAEILGSKYGEAFHPEQIRGACRRRGATEKIKKSRVTFEDRKTVTQADVEAYIEAMIALQEAEKAIDTRQVTATIDLDESKPVGIAHSGDWHVGSKGTDYRLFQQDLGLMLDTPGLYIVGQGDYKDNYIAGTPTGGATGQVVQPEQQDEVVLYFMRRLKERLLALLRGCHDHWSKKQGDTDFVAQCAKEANAVNFWHGGTLTLKLGAQSYKEHVRHRLRFESSLNTTNAMRRMFEFYGEADIAAGAHLHNPEVNERHLQGGYRIMLRCGSYKVWDDHGQQFGYGKGRPGVPLVILFPREHRMIAHRDLRTGIEHLKALRG
jgi:hypothetical protein